MNKTAMAGGRTKTAVKPVKKMANKAAAVKKLSALGAAKPVRDADNPKPTVVTVAEVEALAATAEKLIKSKRTLSAAEKAEKLADVAETLAKARKWGGLSKRGVWWLVHPFGIGLVVHDWKAVLR